MKIEKEKIKFYLISSKNELSKIKANLEKILEPTKLHVINKKENNMYDDWDEYEHDKKKYHELINRIENGEGIEINIFYAEFEGKIIGHVFMIKGEPAIREFLNQINDKRNIENIDEYAIVQAFVIYDRVGELVQEGFHLSDHKIYYRLSKKWLIDIEKSMEKW